MNPILAGVIGGMRVIDNEYLPEGCFALDEGNTILVVTPYGYAVRLEKPYLKIPSELPDPKLWGSYKFSL